MDWRRGFTLIELMVTIGIIALLASLVLASLSTARDKASDAAIKSGLVQLRSQAALYFSKNGNYGSSPSSVSPSCVNIGTMFGSDSNIQALILKINADSGGTAVCRFSPGSNGAWRVASPLRTDPAFGWCVDSTGASKQIALPAGSTC